MNRTKVSNEAPEWFKLINEKNLKKWDEEFIKKGDTLSLFSRYQKWITVTPTHKDRRKPLEKIKIKKMEETSKIMPSWMQVKALNKSPPDLMRSQEYTSLRNVFFIIYFRIKNLLL